MNSTLGVPLAIFGPICMSSMPKTKFQTTLLSTLIHCKKALKSLRSHGGREWVKALVTLGQNQLF